MKGTYHYIREAWKKPSKDLRERLIEWRKSQAVEIVKKPTRLDRARALGYKAKPGIFVARVRLRRGGHKRRRPRTGRKTKRLTVRKTLKLNYRGIAEQRAARKTGLEVLNSYWLAKDGKHYFFEVILVNPNSPEIKKDKNLSWICSSRGRAFRGLTSAGKKSRGLRKKGKRRKRKRKEKKR